MPAVPCPPRAVQGLVWGQDAALSSGLNSVHGGQSPSEEHEPQRVSAPRLLSVQTQLTPRHRWDRNNPAQETWAGVEQTQEAKHKAQSSALKAALLLAVFPEVNER